VVSGKAAQLLLPEIKTVDDYRLVYRDADVWLPAMHTICRRHRLDAASLEFAPPGTHVVFRVDSLYLKLFAPPWRRDFGSERLALSRLSEGPDLPIPRLVAEGEIEGWPYVIMTAVEGVPLCDVWDGLDALAREHIAACCGKLMAAIHAVSTAGLESMAVDWPAFVVERIQERLDSLPKCGLDEQWIQDIHAFLQGDDLPPLFEPGFRPVLLSADVTDEHILVTQQEGQWELTGFIDFGDAMLGHPLYEFVAPGCCITHGSPHLLRAMLLAYGYVEDQFDETLSRQLMAYTLVHRYVEIPYLLNMWKGWRPSSLEELDRELWSLAH